MYFTKTKIDGAVIVDLDKKGDERGYFARAWCAREFEEHGLPSRIAQINLSANAEKGTLRGFHFQYPPASESKFFRCVHGAIYVVVIDLRPESATFGDHVGVELTAESGRAFTTPPRCGTGYISLTDDTLLIYPMGDFYAPGTDDGVAWDDPFFGVEWPMPPTVMSDRDKAWRPFEERKAEMLPRLAAGPWTNATAGMG
jgi:dTDP-4-dehydrorhamnose 3,5-epimerase